MNLVLDHAITNKRLKSNIKGTRILTGGEIDRSYATRKINLNYQPK